MAISSICDISMIVVYRLKSGATALRSHSRCMEDFHQELLAGQSGIGGVSLVGCGMRGNTMMQHIIIA
jgi:hypothetical protein